MASSKIKPFPIQTKQISGTSSSTGTIATGLDIRYCYPLNVWANNGDRSLFYNFRTSSNDADHQIYLSVLYQGSPSGDTPYDITIAYADLT